MNGIYRIADKNIEICSIYSDVHTLCSDYRYEGEPDFTVEILQRDIEFERERSAAEDRAQGHDVIEYSDGYLETLAVYRKIADRMLDYRTILFHGSCVAVDGVGYLFTAKSGTGKSTHTRLWREYFGDRAVMINDDKPLIRISDEGATIYGTPWMGKHGLGMNASVPLSAVCVLERDSENRIVRVEKKSIYPMLLQQTHRPGGAADMAKKLRIIDDLAARVGLYRLGCNMNIEAASVAYEGMVRK